MILPPNVNSAYLYFRKYYLDIFGRFSTPQYGVHILNGHYIDTDNEASSSIFYDTLNQLSKEIDFITFQEGSELVRSRKIPKTDKLVCFSFDDGYEECFIKIKPVLDAFKIKAGFFICPNFVDGTPEYIDNFLKNKVHLKTKKPPMSWHQIKVLHTEGHVIGSHTLNHVAYNHVSDADFDLELRVSKQIIETKLQTACRHFAYTYGKIEHFSEAALTLAERYYTYIYSQAGHQNYFSFNGRVLNRRHFEGIWAKHHITYYLKKNYGEQI
jgi:peptidoglycan/xylan/chitin deacetylase (PgdA/CDA1 family)